MTTSPELTAPERIDAILATINTEQYRDPELAVVILQDVSAKLTVALQGEGMGEVRVEAYKHHLKTIEKNFNKFVNGLPKYDESAAAFLRRKHVENDIVSAELHVDAIVEALRHPESIATHPQPSASTALSSTSKPVVRENRTTQHQPSASADARECARRIKEKCTADSVMGHSNFDTHQAAARIQATIDAAVAEATAPWQIESTESQEIIGELKARNAALEEYHEAHQALLTCEVGSGLVVECTMRFRTAQAALAGQGDGNGGRGNG